MGALAYADRTPIINLTKTSKKKTRENINFPDDTYVVSQNLVVGGSGEGLLQPETFWVKLLN